MQASFVVEFCVVFRHDRLHLLDSLAAVVYRGCFIVNSIVENFNLIDLVGCAFGCFLLCFQNRVFAVFQCFQRGFLLFEFLVTFVNSLFSLAFSLGKEIKSRNHSYNSSCKNDIWILHRCNVKRLLCSGEQSKFFAEHHHKAYVFHKHLRFLNDIGSHKNCLVCSVSSRKGKNGFDEYIVVLNGGCSQPDCVGEHALRRYANFVQSVVPRSFEI